MLLYIHKIIDCFYNILKPLVNWPYCSFARIIITTRLLKKERASVTRLQSSNSFLDAAIIGSFEAPVYSLARGDVFKKPISC
jgi:hypothetical protein